MKIRLDISTRCQLKCPLCPTAKGKMSKTPVKYGTLSFERFQTFINNHPTIQEIEISNYGEVFLNKELPEILEYAFVKNINITIFNGSNLNYASDEQLESLVKYKVRKLTISLDGATQENYSRYRINGNIDKVLNNIKKINTYKKQYHSEYPELIWQFICFSFNIHEIEKAKELADALNMTFFLKKNWDEKFFPLPQNTEFSYHLESFDYKEVDESHILEKEKFYICLQMWQKPQINWNGEVLGCCVNYWDTYGNAFTEGLENVLNNRKYRNTQKLLTGDKFNPDSPCLKCGVFRKNVLKKNRKKYFINSPVKFFIYSLKRLI